MPSLETNPAIIRATLNTYLKTLKAHPYAEEGVIRQAIGEIEALLRASTSSTVVPAVRPPVRNLGESLKASAGLFAVRLPTVVVGKIERYRTRVIGHDLLALAKGLDAPSYMGYYWVTRDRNGITFTD